MEKLKKNKFVAVMIIFLIAAFVPWMWIIQEHGLTNIPHYDLTMWIFMELYALICVILLFGVIAFVISGDEDKPKKEMKAVKDNNKQKQKKKSPDAQKKPEKKKTAPIKSRKPKKDEIPDGSYVEPSEQAARKENETEVEYPGVWDERRFE